MKNIQLNNVTKSFKQTMVLDQLDLSVEQGDLILIQGDNGCGKTTLLKIICGILDVDEGEVIVDPQEKIGGLIENPSFIESQSLKYNLKFLANLNHAYEEPYIRELCKGFRLKFDDKRPIRKYSLGMRQKSGIIQAVMEHQDIILLDEPTRGLDAKSMEFFVSLIHQLHASNKTILICAHDGITDIQFTRHLKMTEGKIKEWND